MRGTVEHLGGDRWRVRIYVEGPDGKRRQVSRSYKANGKRAADRAAPAIIRELEATAADRLRMKGTIAELAGKYLAYMARMGDWSATHAKRQREIVAVIVADLGAVQCHQLRTQHVDDWYVTLLDRGLAASTVHHYSATLHAMLKQGSYWDMSSEAPVRRARLPRVTRPEVVPPTNPVVALVLGQATGALRVALHLAAFTGCRRGEIVGIRWSDFSHYTEEYVDKKGVRRQRVVNVLDVRRSVVEVDGVLSVKLPKSRKARRFTVDPELLALLADWRTEQGQVFARLGRDVPADCFVLADLRADQGGQTPRRPGWLSLAWARHRKALGAESVRLHDLRHWHLSTLAAGGVPMVTVQARGGHADISTTGIYSHALPEGEATTTGVIARALQSAQP